MTEYEDHIAQMADMLREGGQDPSRAAEFDAAVDILVDDGMPVQKATNLMFAALKSGRPLESQARHIVKLRRAIS